MKSLLAIGLFTTSLACGSAWAEEKAPADCSLFDPVIAIGVSYPLVLSASMGVLGPFGKQEKDGAFPTQLSFRAEGEFGLGGVAAAAGLYVPAGGAYAVNLKVERMRTWLWAWNQPVNRTFDGGVAELVLLGHVPGKIGLGYFKDKELLNNRRASFVYVFFGVGW